MNLLIQHNQLSYAPTYDIVTVLLTFFVVLVLVRLFIFSAFAIYSIYLFLNSRPTKELRKKVQTKGGLMIIIHSGCLYGIGRILGELNFAPTIEYINVKLLPSLTEIGLLGAVWSTILSVLAWVLPFATAAVGTNLVTQALCQRTGNECHEAEIQRQPKRFHKHIQSKFTKYKRWSPDDSNSANNTDLENYFFGNK